MIFYDRGGALFIGGAASSLSGYLGAFHPNCQDLPRKRGVSLLFAFNPLGIKLGGGSKCVPPQRDGVVWGDSSQTRCWAEEMNAKYITKPDKFAQILGLNHPDMPVGEISLFPSQILFLGADEARWEGEGSKSVIWGSKVLGKEAKPREKALKSNLGGYREIFPALPFAASQLGHYTAREIMRYICWIRKQGGKNVN